MRVLIATALTQGDRLGDVQLCAEGELVWLSEPCGREKRREKPSCGCGRAFTGLRTGGISTTALVRDIPGLCQAEYRSVVCACLATLGWERDAAAEAADALAVYASNWPTGSVLERDLHLIRLRESTPSRYPEKTMAIATTGIGTAR